jgi:hypothetical protein
MKNQASFVPQGYHSHVKSKLLSVRVPVKQIAKARIKKYYNQLNHNSELLDENGFYFRATLVVAHNGARK